MDSRSLRHLAHYSFDSRKLSAGKLMSLGPMLAAMHKASTIPASGTSCSAASQNLPACDHGPVFVSTPGLRIAFAAAQVQKPSVSSTGQVPSHGVDNVLGALLASVGYARKPLLDLSAMITYQFVAMAGFSLAEGRLKRFKRFSRWCDGFAARLERSSVLNDHSVAGGNPLDKARSIHAQDLLLAGASKRFQRRYALSCLAEITIDDNQVTRRITGSVLPAGGLASQESDVPAVRRPGSGQSLVAAVAQPRLTAQRPGAGPGPGLAAEHRPQLRFGCVALFRQVHPPSVLMATGGVLSSTKPLDPAGPAGMAKKGVHLPPTKAATSCGGNPSNCKTSLMAPSSLHAAGATDMQSTSTLGNDKSSTPSRPPELATNPSRGGRGFLGWLFSPRGTQFDRFTLCVRIDVISGTNSVDEEVVYSGFAGGAANVYLLSAANADQLRETAQFY